MPRKQINRLRPLAALVLASGIAAGALAPLPALAQTAPAPGAAAAFSQDQLEAFAQVALRVAKVREEYTEALEAAETDKEKDRLIREGNSAMLAAVEESQQITIEDYVRIGEAASADQELGQRILRMINERAAAGN